MAKRDLAYLAHRTANRLRIKIPGRRNDEVFFDELHQALVQQDGILAVETNPLTASVVIRHGRHFPLGRLQSLGIELHDASQARGAQSWQELRKLDNGIRTFSGGEVDLASLILKIAVAVVTKQVGAQLFEFLAENLVRAALRAVTATPKPALLPGPAPRPLLMSAA